MSEPKAPEIYSAMRKVMEEIRHVGKDKRNEQQKFRFRGVDDVMNAMHVPFARAGVFVTPEILSERREERATKSGGMLQYTILHVRYTFHAQDGSSVSATVIGEAMDSADKSASKAMSIAFKYAMMQVFSIPTEEQDDPDATTHEDVAPKPETPAPALRQAPPVRAVQKPPAPGLTPAQQVTKMMNDRKLSPEIVGRWLRARYPKIEYKTMAQALSSEIQSVFAEATDQSLEAELSQLGR